MKKVLLALLFVSTSALAADWTNGDAQIVQPKNNVVNQSTISWLAVDNVQASCDKESRKRGGAGFGHSIQACSFWTADVCTIITGKTTSMHAVGHEVLHCFQGKFH